MKQRRYGFECKTGLIKEDLSTTKDPEKALSFASFDKAMQIWAEIQSQIDEPINLIPVDLHFPRKYNLAEI